MKKILFLLSLLILPLSMLFISVKAYKIDVSQLDNINLISNMYQVEGASAYRFEINKSTLPEDNVYLLVQLFNINDLNTPLQISSRFSNLLYRLNNNSTNYSFTSVTTNNNYGYRSSLISLSSLSYIQILPSSSIDINDYVFNITYSYNTNGFIGRFVPNTLYNVGGYNNRGYFQYFSTYLALQGQQVTSALNVSDTMITYNNIAFNTLVDTIYNTQNNNSAYFYYLRVYFNNVALKDLPNLTFKYLQCTGICVNNTYYTYDNAKTNFSWLNRNINVYNDNATLFISDSAINGYENNTIQYMTFTLPDYAFKTSSYYQTSVGIKGYLQRVSISTLSVSSQQAYINGYNYGVESGYNKGYENGLNDGLSSKTTNFDNLMFSIADVPMKIISSMLNFNLLGFNLMAFFMGIITLILFIHILRKFKE